jgi:hypothetical protein
MDIPLTFEQTEFSVHVPHISDSLDVPADEDERESWVQGLVDRVEERETCFYGESVGEMSF